MASGSIAASRSRTSAGHKRGYLEFRDFGLPSLMRCGQRKSRIDPKGSYYDVSRIDDMVTEIIRYKPHDQRVDVRYFAFIVHELLCVKALSRQKSPELGCKL